MNLMSVGYVYPDLKTVTSRVVLNPDFPFALANGTWSLKKNCVWVSPGSFAIGACYQGRFFLNLFSIFRHDLRRES